MPRHFDSQPSVRSTTHRRGFRRPGRRLAGGSLPEGRMCPMYPPPSTAARPLGLSNPASRHRCCSTSSGSGRSTTIASIVAPNSLQSGTLAPAITAPSGPPAPSVTRCFLVPGFPRSVGFLPVFFPPEPGLAQHPVGRLPSPFDPAEFVALGDQRRPDLLEDAALGPPLEPAVQGALGAVLGVQLVPLAAGPHPEDDPIERPAEVGRWPTGALAGPELLEDRLDPPPQLVGDLPDRGQRLAPSLLASHGGGSGREGGSGLTRHNVLHATGIPPVVG